MAQTNKPAKKKKIFKKAQMPNFFINAFYESKFKDSLFIVKASGKVVEDDKALDTLTRNINDLTRHGIKVLLVYGGGEALDREVEKRGVGTKRADGRRVTDAATLDIMKDVIGGRMSLRVYESMARSKLEGISLNAVPPDWMSISLRPKKPVDYGFVGDIHGAHSRPVLRLLRTTNFVAIPCLAWARDEKKDTGTLCNINADTIATEIAIATRAHKLIFLSDVDGVTLNGKTAFIITAEEISAYIADGSIYGGMKVKMENCKRALEAGVKRIHLINGLRKDALRNEIYEPVGPGTMLITESEREHYMNEVEAQKVIEGQQKKKQAK